MTEILLDKGTGLSRTANQDKVVLRSSSTTPGAALVEVIAADGSSGATLAEQESQTALLELIEQNTTGLVKNDNEIPFVWFLVKQAFTDVLISDIVVAYAIINTGTGAGTAYTKRWRGFIDVTVPDPITDYLVPTGGMPLTYEQLKLIQGDAVASPAQYTSNYYLKSLLGFPRTSGFIARPANTTAYSAGDVKGATVAAFEVQNLGTPNSTCRITKAVMKINASAVPPGMTYFTLKVYSATPPSALADNVAWTAVGDELVKEGEIILENMVVDGNYLRGESTQTFDCKLSSTGSLFFYVVTAGAYTPTSGAQIEVIIYPL